MSNNNLFNPNEIINKLDNMRVIFFMYLLASAIGAIAGGASIFVGYIVGFWYFRYDAFFAMFFGVPTIIWIRFVFSILDISDTLLRARRSMAGLAEAIADDMIDAADEGAFRPTALIQSANAGIILDQDNDHDEISAVNAPINRVKIKQLAPVMNHSLDVSAGDMPEQDENPLHVQRNILIDIDGDGKTLVDTRDIINYIVETFGNDTSLSQNTWQKRFGKNKYSDIEARKLARSVIRYLKMRNVITDQSSPKKYPDLKTVKAALQRAGISDA